MYSTIGHYKHVSRFGSHLGLPASMPKYHSFIGMPRPMQATGGGTVDLPSDPIDFYKPNQGVPPVVPQLQQAPSKI